MHTPESSPDYAAKLLTIAEAEKKFRMSPNTFKRFRREHAIKTLTGQLIHEDDITRGFDRERGVLLQPKPHHV